MQDLHKLDKMSKLHEMMKKMLFYKIYSMYRRKNYYFIEYI